jgi:hypothetical protein
LAVSFYDLRERCGSLQLHAYVHVFSYTYMYTRVIHIYIYIYLLIYLFNIYICTYVYFVCVSGALKKGACDDSVYILAWDSLQIPFSFFVFLIAYDCLVL